MSRQSVVVQIVEHISKQIESGGSHLRACLSAFCEAKPNPRAVLDHLTGLDASDQQALFDGSHETTTHYKWLLYRQYSPWFTLWLHEYKPRHLQRLGYAQVPHNHRYDISSVILAGGYAASAWQLLEDNTVAATHVKQFRFGDVMQLKHNEIHSLDEISEGTITLVAEGHRIKGVSQAYYPGQSQPRQFPDFPQRWPELVSQLDRH